MIEKLNKPSFGYYKFISAGKEKPDFSDRHHTMERKNNSYFLMDSSSFIKKLGVGDKKKLVSKMDVMSLSGVMYPYVSKIFYTTHKTLSNKSVNKFTFYFKRKWLTYYKTNQAF